MNIYLPYPKSTITQRFGANANPLYAGQGLRGHPAYDWGVAWGTDVPNCVKDAYCYSIMHKDDPVLMDYRAVFTIVEDENGDVYEISYGHLSDITAEVGKTYQVGDIIGRVGNTGPVYAGAHQVTEAEKDAGSHAGAHLHGPQVRPCRKVRSPITGPGYFNHYLTTADATLYRDAEGFYYEVIDYQNGYNGCISLAPFSTETIATDQRTLAETEEQVIATAASITAQVAALPKEQQKTYLPSLSQIVNNIFALFKRR